MAASLPSSALQKLTAEDAAALPCGVACYTDRGDMLWCNPALRDLLGLAADAPLPALFSGMLTTASRILYLTGITAKLLTDQWVEESYLSLRASNGTEVPVLVNIRREQRPGEAPHNLAVLMRIRDRKRLEDELMRARRATEQVPGLICQLLRTGDGHTSLPYASEAIQDLFGITPAQARLSAKPLKAMVLPGDWPALRASLEASARKLSPWHHQFRVMKNEAVHWIEGRAIPQRLTDGGLLWHAYLCDVTERHERESLAHEKALAERASEAKTAFLARVSHELRTPLNAVLGFAQLLAQDRHLNLQNHHRSYLQHIETAGQSLLALVNDVLDLTRIETGVIDVRLGRCELAPLAAHSLGLVELPAQQAGVSLRVSVRPGLWVQADGHKLGQCLVNLLTNAVKYNREGGWVTLSAEAEGNRIRISVQDTGPGLTTLQREHLFEPFNRLGADQGQVQGSGLGLVIARSLIERMGGQLQLDSVPGEGSCFSLLIPASEPDKSQTPNLSAQPAAVAPKIRPATRSVLYVDDNPVNLLLMEALFGRRPDLQLQCAASGSEALQLAACHPPQLFLIDIGLPDINGLVLLGCLRALPGLQAAPAVAVSADALRSDIDRALSSGFQAYWTKPLDLNSTLQALDRLLPPQS